MFAPRTSTLLHARPCERPYPQVRVLCTWRADWERSPIEEAIFGNDGRDDQTCFAFVAHRHCQVADCTPLPPPLHIPLHLLPICRHRRMFSA